MYPKNTPIIDEHLFLDLSLSSPILPKENVKSVYMFPIYDKSVGLIRGRNSSINIALSFSVRHVLGDDDTILIISSGNPCLISILQQSLNSPISK